MISHIEIQDGVKMIGKRCFLECANLKSVNIPDSVISIGEYAFWGCNELISVSVPAKTEIAYEAFPNTVYVIYR